MQKVLVGMSGGVDSSVAAYLLKKEGYEVEGISFILWGESRFSTCLLQEASKAAHYAGIPHSIIDVREAFLEKVVEPFVDAYMKGLTPNPCILCNRFIKFPFLLNEAKKRNAGYIATGHYARVERSQNGIVFLKKGVDQDKDQSYVLHVLRDYELRKLILPLGYYKKEEVRKIAKDLNLTPANMSESHDICFIKDRNYFKFIERIFPQAGKAGPIVDMTGRVIGTHKGIYRYTIGQRKRLGISSASPLYVVKIDALKNTVYVGSKEDAKKREFLVKNMNWLWNGARVYPKHFRASVKIRSTMKDEPARVFLETNSGEIIRVVFDEPQWAPAPGQSAVFYDGDITIGGGIICE